MPVIAELADKYWNKIIRKCFLELKKILEEIDSTAYMKALSMNAIEIKQYAVKQDEYDRKNYDEKWDCLNQKLRQQDSGYKEPELPFKQ